LSSEDTAVKSSSTRADAAARREEEAMPLYQYYCDQCKREVSLTMTMSEHGKGGAACPECGSRGLRPLLGTVFTQTSRKS
jgi:putative FmdB family regulatory protein